MFALPQEQPTMPAPQGMPGDPKSGRLSTTERSVPAAFRVLDWTNLDSPPTSIDVARLAALGEHGGSARIAVLVNSPRMLRAATAFAEQAGLHGAQVRVFVDSKEALTW